MDGGLISTSTFELNREKENHFPSLNPIGNVRVINTPEEAFESFDALDESQARIQFIIKSGQQNSGSAEQVFRSGLLLVDNGEYRLARNLFIETVTLDPCHADALRWLGWSEKQLGDLDQAEACYEQLAILRGTPHDIFEYGEILYLLKRDDEALQLWFQASRMVEAEDPIVFDIYKNIGNAFTRLGDFESAEENYNKALTLRPNSDVIQVNLGTLCFQARDRARAEVHYRLGCELNPRNDLAWCGLALLAAEAGDRDRARSLVLQAVDANSSSVQALQLLVQWAQEDSRFDEAIERVTRYVAENPSDWSMHYVLAGVQFQAGWFDEAGATADFLVQQQPKDDRALELKKIIQQKRAEHGRP